jgi:hypothetical protein
VRILLTLTICLLFCLGSFGQTVVSDDIVGVEEIYLAKDNGQGKAGEKSESFFTNDVPIYCVVQLNSTKSATVKMNFVAVKVSGVKADSQVFTISYTTSGNQSRVSFTGKPDGGKWTAGTYRIDILVDNKVGQNLTFEIQKTAKDIEAEARSKPKTPTKPIRKFRKP